MERCGFRPQRFLFVGSVTAPLSGRITALKAQTKNRGRVNVYLDGSFAFGLAEIVAARLRVGQSLSDDDIASLRQCDAQERAYDQALRFLSYRPRSTEEVRRFLAGKDVPPEVATATLARLTGAGLLDDEAFARFWVENRESFRPRGPMALCFELRRKGVSQEAIEQALGAADEKDAAYRAARTHAARLEHADRATFFRRLGEFLQRRGFHYETVRETVDRLWREKAARDQRSSQR